MNDWPIERAELLGDGAADEVHAAAGLDGSDDLHGLGGVALRGRKARQQRGCGEEGGGDGNVVSFHDGFSSERSGFESLAGGTHVVGEQLPGARGIGIAHGPGDRLVLGDRGGHADGLGEVLQPPQVQLLHDAAVGLRELVVAGRLHDGPVEAQVLGVVGGHVAAPRGLAHGGRGGVEEARQRPALGGLGEAAARVPAWPSSTPRSS